MKGFDLRLLRLGIKKEITKEEQILQNINHALIQMKHARSNFDMVVGADNVELAILELNTAEKRYQNLLKEAKRLGITKGMPGSLAPKPIEEEMMGDSPLEQS